MISFERMHPPEGTLRFASREPVIPFVGWLGLMDALSHLLGPPSEAADEGEGDGDDPDR